MIGVIGGTGLYAIDGLEVRESREVETPFGPPSAPITLGGLHGADVAFLPRHGLHHEFLPSEINFRANIWALKQVGVRQIVSVSATGSLVQEIAPGDLALASQYFDWTKGRRVSSFFGDGLVAHVSTAEPSCPALGRSISESARKAEVKLHRDRTYACVEGPRLGTRAESFFLKGAGCHLVGMTNVPESLLAREAQICYCTVAVATDYDCWMDDPNEHVSLDKVLARYRETLGRVKKILGELVVRPAAAESCGCRTALKEAVLTEESALSPAKKELLRFLRI